MAKSPSPLRFLSQALHLPSKNPKLFFNVFLLYILSHALLYVGLQESIAPLVSKLTELVKLLPTIDSSSPEFSEIVDTIKGVTKELLVFEIVYYVILFVISCFLSIITYYANSMTYQGEVLTLKEVLNKVKGLIKGPLITHLVVGFSFLVYIISVSVIVFAIYRYVSSDFDINSLFWVIPSVIFASLLLIYLSIIWSMGIAISVIEPTLYGFRAISQGRKFLKGKKMQVFFLILSLITIAGIVYVCETTTMKFVSDSKACSLVLGFVYQLLLLMMKFYTTMAITILYYEYNQSNGDELEYTKLAATVTV